MQRDVRVQVSGKFGTAGLLPGLPYREVWQCNVLTTLLWIGVLTAPPRYRGFDLSTFWAWIRYASAISERHSDLRLKPIWSDIDAHQKTVMSDDFGMGFSCHYLAEQHGIQAFANTGYLLDSLVGVTTLRPSKRGPAKSPDFIGIDAQGRLHILECKGTQSSIDYLLRALESGIEQKENFTNSTPFASSMVGGIFVPQHRSQESALLMYIDPEPDPRLQQISDMPHGRIEGAIYRISLAKELMAAGLWRTASRVERRDRPSEFAETSLTTIDVDLAFSGFVKGDQAWRRTTEYRSIEIDSIRLGDSEQVKEYARKTTLSIEFSDEVADFTRKVLEMDSGGAYASSDKLIVDRARARRQRRLVRIQSQGSEDDPVRTLTRRVESSWSEQTPSQASATLTGPSGIRFELSREDGS